jgi:hypothetical protein
MMEHYMRWCVGLGTVLYVDMKRLYDERPGVSPTPGLVRVPTEDVLQDVFNTPKERV